MNNDIKEEFLNKIADERLKEEKLLEENPLLRFSTTQLKAELRRRKRKYHG